MDKFELLSENAEVQDQYIESTMSSATSMTTPANQVDDLISKVAMEYGLQIEEQLSKAQPASGISTGVKQQDDLAERLSKLKSMA